MTATVFHLHVALLAHLSIEHTCVTLHLGGTVCMQKLSSSTNLILYIAMHVINSVRCT